MLAIVELEQARGDRASALAHLQRSNIAPVDLAQVGHSSLDWDVSVVPFGAAAGELPAVSPHEAWGYARDVRAATVQTKGSREAERYIFYRGLGHMASGQN